MNLIKFKTETEIIGFLQVCGVSYSMAVALNKMVKEKYDPAESKFIKLGLGLAYCSIYEFYHGK